MATPSDAPGAHSTPRRANAFKVIAINLAVLLVTTLAVFIVGEVVVRLLYKDEIVLFPRYHTDARYGDFTMRTIRPNETFWHTSVDGRWRFTTNNRGFRDEEDIDYDKPAGEIRVLALGDSHTQGYEVRQDFTFSAVAEQYLRRHGYQARVINAGVSGFSTAEALVFLENEGIRYQPDVVVLGFYANDFQDNIKANFFKLDADQNLLVNKYQHIPGVRIQNLLYSLPVFKWLGENSYFYAFGFNTVWTFFKTALTEKSADEVFEYAVATPDDISSYQQALTSELIKRMHAFCRQHGIKLIIVDIPALGSGHAFKSSVPSSFKQTMIENSEAYLDSEVLLTGDGGGAQIHVPGGHRHISEFTHGVIGLAIAKQIVAWLNQRH
jgi:lysophospholipase L1-like esterase